MLLVLRGEARRAARRSAQIMSRQYTLDRITPPNAMSSSSHATTSMTSETLVQDTLPSTSAYVLVRPPTIPSIEYSYQLETMSRLEQQLHHSQAMYPEEATREALSAPREPWLMIAGVGCLSFYGLMWIGDLEAAGNRAELEKCMVAGDVAMATDVNPKPASKIKAEWFRPF